MAERLQAGGTIYPSTTRLGDALYIRFCIMHFRTHRAEIDRALEEVRSLTLALAKPT
jgi:hypothetical protein